MIELSNERIGQILHEETPKKEELTTVLRGIYTRYMRLYEKYFADTDALNDEEIAKLREYHANTRSLIKVYYMDIPQDICIRLREFDDKYSEKLLGPDWRQCLLDNYENYRKKNKCDDKSEESLKAEFKEETLADFYNAMDYTFREGFDTGSQKVKKLISGLKGLLFGKEE